MIKILYEDDAVLVAVKPAGLESQASRKLEPDMVSEIKNYLLRSRRRKERQEGRGLSTTMSTNSSTQAQEPYVGVIHRLDKPVSGVMVYAKTKEAAAFLSKEVQAHRVTKIYHAVICGKPVDNVGKYVDYLLKDGKTNTSRIVDKSAAGAKRAELEYQILEEKEQGDGAVRSLVEIHLHTGRHHQIRVQFAAHGTPLVGDTKYGAPAAASVGRARREPLALCAVRLSFLHPVTGERMEFSTEPQFTL